VNNRVENLVVWQKSINLVEIIYKLTSNFPKEELYSLTSQIRRSSISIPSNIAEGKGRNSVKEFINFLHIALGSLFELKTQLYISVRLKYITEYEFDKIQNLLVEIEKMINSLINNRRKVR